VEELLVSTKCSIQDSVDHQVEQIGIDLMFVVPEAVGDSH